METNEEEIIIPAHITDPEEREVYVLLRKAQILMSKKHMGYALITLSGDSAVALLFLGGCQNCLELALRKVFESDNKFLPIVTKALAMHFFDKGRNSTDNTDSDDAKE
ncbi:hypothetical protein IR083_10005 [Dysgonomonas sp. GY75]|uniref:hypothetical protein n=1 Tax=Dysgonomonas sp. GY75 TaxID=2780419 RepID=UPI00188319A3|nr:hypothetical protein [Dysgonomonas sp. GY75]MBF0649153.1 hypothetical protein [Dysgonomonas sp. GY75]